MTTDTISPDLRTVLRRLKLSGMSDTLPERLTLARGRKMPHHDFLELVLADELTRRDCASAARRSRAARLDPALTLDAFDETVGVTYDRDLWAELTTLRFVEAARHAVILGPVGVGKTHMATALGHIAVRRRLSVVFWRTDKLLRHLKACRLDGTHEQEMRRLIRVDLVILDDFALTALDHSETASIYELIVERAGAGSIVLTSNRDPAEWLAVMADPLLAQSAVDRLQGAAYELIIEGDSYRRRQRPRLAAAGSAGAEVDPG
jgi:DNA replication protein DnaC